MEEHAIIEQVLILSECKIKEINPTKKAVDILRTSLPFLTNSTTSFLFT